jgi:hypothetical protein
MAEGFRPVLQIAITKWNLALWPKSQPMTLGRKEGLRKGIVGFTYEPSIKGSFIR